jgi:2'-5' RNA ligase
MQPFKKKDRFPTSEEIYNRIRSDSTIFQQSKAVITYFDSIKDKFIDISFCQWKSIKDGGDIPWHRVYFIKYFEEGIIWNRNDRICTISELYHKLNQQNTEESLLPENLSLLTFNILSDYYDKQITNLKYRKDSLLSYLLAQSEKYCFLCLQEVTSGLYEDLLIAFKDKKFQIIKSDLLRNDLVFLSKIPFSSFDIISLNSNKQILKITFHNILEIFIVHLTSNHSSLVQQQKGRKSNGNPKTKRNLQLSQLLQSSCVDISTIIVGDFNTTEFVDILGDADFVEVGSEEGNFSYNPEINRFAKLLSCKQQKENYDRLFYRSAKNGKNCLSISSLAIIDNSVILSDHFPVSFNLKLVSEDEPLLLSSSLSSTLSHSHPSQKRVLSPNKFALSLVVPYKYWRPLSLFKGNNNSYNSNGKWMPHIHLFFPFLSELTNEERLGIEAIFTRKERKYFNSRIVINQLSYFQQSSSSFTLFGQCDEQSRCLLTDLAIEISDFLSLSFDSSQYHPHLTLGYFSSKEEVERCLTLFHSCSSRSLFPIEVPFRRLCYLTNRNNSYYEVIGIFGSSRFEGSFVEFLQKICPASDATILLGGSKIFSSFVEDIAASDKESTSLHDYDFLIIGNKNQKREEFMNRLCKILKSCGLFMSVTVINNSYTNYLKMKSDSYSSLSYDIHYVELSTYELYHRKKGVGGLSLLDYNSIAVYEASILIKKLHENHFDLFCQKLSFLKCFAKRVGIYGSSYGYLPGIAFPILLSKFFTTCSRNKASIEETKGNDEIIDTMETMTILNNDNSVFLRRFCQFYLDYDYTHPICVPHLDSILYLSSHRRDHSQMQIINPVLPFGNVARTMTKSSFQYILSTFQRFSNSTLPASMSSVSFGPSFLVATKIIAYASTTELLDLFQNMFDGLYLRMILLFEDNGIFPVGSHQSIVNREEKSFHYSFYYERSLLEVNTVWLLLQGNSEKNFGKNVFLSIQ